MSPLSANAIQEKLRSVPAWKLVAGEIVREASFKDFPAAMEFVNHVAEKAEAAGHHPDIDIRYSKVKLALVSHDAGGITEKDFDLAHSIDSILNAAH